MKNTINSKIQNKKYWIFDFDETVGKLDIDWSDWHRKALEIFLEFEPEFDPAGEVRMDKFVAGFMKKYGRPMRDKIWQLHSEHERENIRGVIPNPEMIELIKNDEEHEKYVYSSNVRETIEKAVEEVGLAGKFVKLVTFDDVQVLKPDPDGFQYMYKGDDKSQYVMFGDSYKDEGMAKAVGIDFVKVEYDFTRSF